MCKASNHLARSVAWLRYPVTKYTQQQLAGFPWIVSCDTLRTEDLLPKFWSVAEGLAVWLDRPKMLDASTLVSLAKLVGEDSKAEDWNDSEAAQTLGDLFDVLDEAAPVGFGFGASEGDGACFGFWLSEDWAEALEILGFGNDDPTGWASLIEELEADGIEADGIEDAYQGRAEGISAERAGADYAQQLAEDVGEIDWARLQWPLTCIDWADAWRELELADGFRLHDIGGGEWLVFRNI